MSTAEYRAECEECPYKGNRLANRSSVEEEARIHSVQSQHSVKVVIFEPIQAGEVRFISNDKNFSEDIYKEMFNSFILKPVELKMESEKALLEMSDEELVEWVHKMEDFIRIAKVASTSARVTLEDRKLKLSSEQAAALAKLDRAYKPKTVRETESKAKRESNPLGREAKTPEEKKLAATMKILGMSEEDAKAWLAAQTKTS